eukprot:m.14760 g.14760  ORF g.14760 m.14760 type:complete len:71 (+) comp5197_c0_seq1:1649-1861(+)
MNWDNRVRRIQISGNMPKQTREEFTTSTCEHQKHHGASTIPRDMSLTLLCRELPPGYRLETSALDETDDC